MPKVIAPHHPNPEHSTSHLLAQFPFFAKYPLSALKDLYDSSGGTHKKEKRKCRQFENLHVTLCHYNPATLSRRKWEMEWKMRRRSKVGQNPFWKRGVGKEEDTLRSPFITRKSAEAL